MSISSQGDLSPINSSLGHLRQLLEEVLSIEDDDAVEPELLERLSRAAAETAELERERRRKRRERAVAIARKVSELFPEMAETAAIVFERFRDDKLDRAAAAVELASEVNERLAEADSRVRAALDRRDYSGAQDHAGRAREHQAAIAVQGKVLAALLAPASDGGAHSDGDDDGDGDAPGGDGKPNSPNRPAPGPRTSSSQGKTQSTRVERRHEPSASRPALSIAVIDRTGVVAEPGSVSIRLAEPHLALGPVLKAEERKSAVDVKNEAVATPDLVRRLSNLFPETGNGEAGNGADRSIQDLDDRIASVRTRIERDDARWSVMGRWRRGRAADEDGAEA